MNDEYLTDREKAIIYNKNKKTKRSVKKERLLKNLSNDVSLYKTHNSIVLKYGGERIEMPSLAKIKSLENEIKKTGSKLSRSITDIKRKESELKRLSNELKEAKQESLKMSWE